jgi:hypothetical protein
MRPEGDRRPAPVVETPFAEGVPGWQAAKTLRETLRAEPGAARKLQRDFRWPTLRDDQPNRSRRCTGPNQDRHQRVRRVETHDTPHPDEVTGRRQLARSESIHPLCTKSVRETDEVAGFFGNLCLRVLLKGGFVPLPSQLRSELFDILVTSN